VDGKGVLMRSTGATTPTARSITDQATGGNVRDPRAAGVGRDAYTSSRALHPGRGRPFVYIGIGTLLALSAAISSSTVRSGCGTPTLEVRRWAE